MGIIFKLKFPENNNRRKKLCQNRYSTSYKADQYGTLQIYRILDIEHCVAEPTELYFSALSES